MSQDQTMALVDLTSRRASQRITEMVDEMLAAYVDWRETAAKSKVAYGRWSQSPAPDRELRFATFVAALDQEQSAAANYAGIVGGVARVLEGGAIRDPDRPV
jgi:hypothetical protein